MMKKYIMDLTVRAVERVHERYVLIRLTDERALPAMLPGQFVEVRVDGSPRTFLRRPISICFVDYKANELWLLVAVVGDGTRRLGEMQAGERLNCVLPLGNGFRIDQSGETAAYQSGETALHSDPRGETALRGREIQSGETALHTHQNGKTALHGRPGGANGRPGGKSGRLMVGGGVGVAPLLYLGATLKEQGEEPTFLLGARSAKDLLLISEFEKYGRVLVTTEDGSEGERGFVTNHSVLQEGRFEMIQCCGPTPMMKAVAHYAREKGIECEVSLENLMACGLGACLCCVEKVAPSNPSEGNGEPTNVCVCKDGPVFNINRLLW